jgi:hypothetical protein
MLFEMGIFSKLPIKSNKNLHTFDEQLFETWWTYQNVNLAW